MANFIEDLNNARSCYFCNSKNLLDSKKRRPIKFFQLHKYLLCSECNAFSLYPKLEQFEISALYSPGYINNVNHHIEIELDEKKDRFTQLFRVIKNYTNETDFKFLDYGCGSTAEVVIRAANLGIDSFGVEVEADTRFIAQKESGRQIFSPREIIESGVKFDVVFLGDVLEHLNSPKETLTEIFNMLDSEGVLIVQGPLEGAATISNFLLSIKSLFQRHVPSEFPPYHVSLATRKSLASLLENSNFKILSLNISEPMWPAPRFGSTASFHSLSSLVFSFTKLLDIALSRLFRNFGTRFFLEATKISSI